MADPGIGKFLENIQSGGGHRSGGGYTAQGADPHRRNTTYKEFSGMNTSGERNGVGEDEFWFLENIMPVGRANLKSVPGPGYPNIIIGVLPQPIPPPIPTPPICGFAHMHTPPPTIDIILEGSLGVDRVNNIAFQAYKGIGDTTVVARYDLNDNAVTLNASFAVTNWSEALDTDASGNPYIEKWNESANGYDIVRLDPETLMVEATTVGVVPAPPTTLVRLHVGKVGPTNKRYVWVMTTRGVNGAVNREIWAFKVSDLSLHFTFNPGGGNIQNLAPDDQGGAYVITSGSGFTVTTWDLYYLDNDGITWTHLADLTDYFPDIPHGITFDPLTQSVVVVYGDSHSPTAIKWSVGSPSGVVATYDGTLALTWNVGQAGPVNSRWWDYRDNSFELFDIASFTKLASIPRVDFPFDTTLHGFKSAVFMPLDNSLVSDLFSFWGQGIDHLCLDWISPQP